MQTYELLGIYSKVLSTYDQTVAKTCQQYGLNHTCFNILLFLKKNPHYDTAKQIEEKRSIKKAMASVAIEQLYQSGYLIRRTDESDRRVQHLSLTEKSKEITDIGEALQNRFQELLFSDLSPEERTIYADLSQKILNTLQTMEGKELL